LEPYRIQMKNLATKTHEILEIGPSYNPIVTKAEGYKVKIVDHCDKENLIAKYSKFGVETQLVEEVDYVTTDIGEIQDENSFDIIYASHLIEHTPNLIRFLKDAQRLAKRNGILALLIPDKSATFDFYRPLSTPGQVIDAHEQNRSRHIGTLFDHYLYFCKSNEQLAWSPQEIISNPQLQHTHDEALEQYKQAKESNEYFDAHSWVFTPESFELIINELNKLDLIEWKIDHIGPSQGFEFLCVLSRESTRVPFSTPTLITKIHESHRNSLVGE
jgi:2-polyprenyl-3-methyl-5-hydroxy-6-metoxy-1,4-benzoquinol methylase